MKPILILLLSLLGACTSIPAVQQPKSYEATSSSSEPAKASSDPDVSALAADFAAATAEACAPTSPTDPKPIDPVACQCNTYLTSVLPTLRPSGPTGQPIADAERLRILRIRLQTGDSKTKFQLACGALHMQLRDDALTAAAFIAMFPK